jgi:hypothetical protein
MKGQEMADKIDTQRIRTAVATIERQSVALSWLEAYGVQLTGKDDGTVSVNVDAGFAASCKGFTEAMSVMAAYMRLSTPEIVETAIRSVRNDIEIARDQILNALGGRS